MTSPLLPWVALICLAACGTPTPAGVDAGNGCNALVNGAPSVSKVSNAGPPPTMTGGTLMDGTWFLTSMDRYNNSTGSSTHRETWVFSGSNVQIATFKSTDGIQKNYSATYSTSGNQVTLSVTCPMTATLVSAFTASATTLQVINSDDANEMHTFTRQ
jgi:hypothetical protein